MLFKALAAAATLATASAIQAGPISGLGTWESTLQARDLDSDGATDAFYDSILNVTWFANANANGRMNYSSALTWVNSLQVGQVAGWRLPRVLDPGGDHCDLSYVGGTECGYWPRTKSGSPELREAGQIVYSEFAHLWYVTLGNLPLCNAFDPNPNCRSLVGTFPDPGFQNTGPFVNAVTFRATYWLSPDAGPQANAWIFDASHGYQNIAATFQSFYAIAVRDGDVSVVPEPSSIALLAVALSALSLLGLARPSSVVV